MNGMNERNLNLDIIRCVAVFNVISVHFFLYTDFTNVQLLGGKMFVQLIVRTFNMTCVPLFLMLTGFLMHTKQLNKRYYKGIFKVLSIYALASISCLLYDYFIRGWHYSFFTMIYKILNFTAAPYSWYINMYIGLFLFIPFLNILWNNMELKKHRTILTLTLIICSTFPSLFNNLGINFWAETLYPIMYYFIGAYISTYKSRINVKLNLLLLIFLIFAFSLINFYRFHGSFLPWANEFSYMGYQCLVISVVLFLLLLNFQFSAPNIIYKIIQKVSKLSLSIYLVSSIFDSCFYPIFCQKVSDMPSRILFYPIIIIIIFITSSILSQILFWIYEMKLKIVENISSVGKY